MLNIKHRHSGFTNQQALLLLLICFPVGLIFLGLMVMLLQRPAPQATAPTESAPQRPVEPETRDDGPSEIQPRKPIPQVPSSGLSEPEARAVVEQWLTVKSQIFAPPYDTDLADQVVADGPLWRDLTKADGSIQWLKNNNSYYTYDKIRVDQVIRFNPSPTMPSMVVRVTENSNLNYPNGRKPSTSTNDWIYTLKKEGGAWKIWDYRKQ